MTDFLDLIASFHPHPSLFWLACILLTIPVTYVLQQRLSSKYMYYLDRLWIFKVEAITAHNAAVSIAHLYLFVSGLQQAFLDGRFQTISSFCCFPPPLSARYNALYFLCMILKLWQCVDPMLLRLAKQPVSRDLLLHHFLMPLIVWIGWRLVVPSDAAAILPNALHQALLYAHFTHALPFSLVPALTVTALLQPVIVSAAVLYAVFVRLFFGLDACQQNGIETVCAEVFGLCCFMLFLGFILQDLRHSSSKKR